jgi:hypothetical protein
MEEARAKALASYQKLLSGSVVADAVKDKVMNSDMISINKYIE